MHPGKGPWVAEQNLPALAVHVAEFLPERPGFLLWMALEINTLIQKAEPVLHFEVRHMLSIGQH